LLSSWPACKQSSVKLFCDAGFFIIDPAHSSSKISVSLPHVVIHTSTGNLCLNRKKVKPNQFYIVPQKGYITFEDRPYQGAFLVIRDKDDILVINCVDLEDYICSVLRSESWPGWPLEVNKVFAIASRSYAMAMMDIMRKKKKLYHVSNTNHHQTYTGIHNNKTLHDAVDQTKGVCLMSQGKPILAMFDSCCGGIIPARIADFDFEKVPYLKRSYACTKCKRCSIYSWNAEYNIPYLEKALKCLIPTLKKLSSIRVSKKDKAGIAQEIVVEPGGHKISGKKLYTLLKDVKSYWFTAKKNKNKIILSGRGYGHHMGLCQWGAREMVRDGLNYKRILHFYYPGTKLSRLT